MSNRPTSRRPHKPLRGPKGDPGVGTPGPEGPPGIGIAPTTRIAGQDLGGHRAVYVGADDKAYYSEPDANAWRTIGITTGAASTGAAASIQIDGEITEPSWAWAAGPVWLAAAGQLTQVVPTSGALFQVGTSMGPTKLRIEPRLIAQL